MKRYGYDDTLRQLKDLKRQIEGLTTASRVNTREWVAKMRDLMSRWTDTLLFVERCLDPNGPPYRHAIRELNARNARPFDTFFLPWGAAATSRLWLAIDHRQTELNRLKSEMLGYLESLERENNSSNGDWRAGERLTSNCRAAIQQAQQCVSNILSLLQDIERDE